MENNSFCEVLVKVKPTKWENFLSKALWVLTFVYLALGLIYIIFLAFFLVFLIAALLYRRHLRLEYEYQYLDGGLRIDRIKNRSKRKKLGVYSMENLTVMAPEGHDRLSPYTNRKELKVLDYSSHDPTAELRYILVFQGGGVIQLLLLEPTQAMVQAMWRAAPSKVVRKAMLPGQ
ncbi:MAG: hypothetical protein LUC30_05320 [Clostridiales bacterium]|nr:hypothetical protein [Clostridiales bacterium]